MANKKYYHSETMVFQNDDSTVARQLTIKRLRLLTEIFGDHEKEQNARQRRVADALQASKKAKIEESEDEIIARISQEIEDEGGKSYLDVLVEGSALALHSWGVKDLKNKSVEVDIEYVEENLDYPSMVRICEIAGSMELGNTENTDSGKEQG